MNGLRIREKLSEDMTKYKPAAELDQMLTKFEQVKVKRISDDMYNTMTLSNIL
jgi:hypothetical protein